MLCLFPGSGLLASQTAHLDDSEGLQKVSGPSSPQVAFTKTSAFAATLNVDGKRPLFFKLLLMPYSPDWPEIGTNYRCRKKLHFSFMTFSTVTPVWNIPRYTGSQCFKSKRIWNILNWHAFGTIVLSAYKNINVIYPRRYFPAPFTQKYPQHKRVTNYNATYGSRVFWGSPRFFFNIIKLKLYSEILIFKVISLPY